MTSRPADPYAAKPWLAVYRDGQAPSLRREHADMLSLFRGAAATPGALALRYFDGAMTFGDLDAASAALAVWLGDQGVGASDRVCVILQNTPAFVIGLLAAWKLGAIPVPSNPMYRRDELAKLFADCEPGAVLCHDDHRPVVIEALRQAAHPAAVLAVSAYDGQSRNDARVLPPPVAPPVASGGESLAAVLAAYAGRAPPDRTPQGQDLGLLLYTSGTTGQPKGAMLRHDSMAFTSQIIRDWCGIGGDGAAILGLAPLFHVTGIICHVGAAFSARCPLILTYRFEPSLMLETIRERRPTYTIGAITAFNALMNAPGAAAEDFASFGAVYSGGAPIAPALADAIFKRLGTPIWPAYGMTETTSPTHLCPLGVAPPVDPVSGALSIGVPAPDTEAMIVGEDGRPLPVGESGEVWMRGPQIMAGYWKKPAETAEALSEGWMRSGDVGFMDPAGWFYLIDRKKDMISASGFKVWPREVEDVLQTHPAVREAAVIGEPDPYRGETVKAFVSLKPGAAASAEALASHCAERLAAYKRPRTVVILDELPKTLTGKIQRAALRESAR